MLKIYFAMCHTENQTIFMHMVSNKVRKMFKLFNFQYIHVNSICKLHSASDKQLMMRSVNHIFAWDRIHVPVAY